MRRVKCCGVKNKVVLGKHFLVILFEQPSVRQEGIRVKSDILWVSLKCIYVVEDLIAFWIKLES